MEEQEKNKVFRKSSEKLEDEKSTAYTFIIVGCLGFVLELLFWLGVLPFHLADYMKIIMTLFMSALFLIFILIGIFSFRKTKTLKTQAASEDQLTAEISGWFLSAFSAAQIDETSGITASEEKEEQLYFLRYEVMKKELQKKYPDLEESFEDHLLETFYSELYPQ